MKTFKEFLEEAKLTEASLGRFYQHYKNNEPILFISADRNENSKKENDENFMTLKRHIGLSGFGYNRVKGGYIEDGKRIDNENSLVVYGTADKEQELYDLGMSLGKYFKQDSIMFIDSKGESNWISTRNDSQVGPIGSKQKLGKFRTKQINDFFTRIKNKTFTFDSINESEVYYPSIRERQLSVWYKKQLLKDKQDIVEKWEANITKC